MSELPHCPRCNSEYSYEDEKVVKDSNGNVLMDGDHDIDCKVPGIGAMKLKSEFVKKV